MSLYDDLGIDPGADADAIRKAHRRRARETHPDAGGDADEFHKVQRAYLVLRDPKTRQRYDETGEDEIAPDNELAEIAKIIVSAFDQATGECRGMFDRVDLIAQMRQVLVQRLAASKEMLANLKAGVTAIESIADRLSYSGDRTDMIGTMLRGRLEENRQAQAKVSAEIESIERAQVYAKDYGYRFDVQMPPDMWGQNLNSAMNQRPGGLGGFFR